MPRLYLCSVVATLLFSLWFLRKRLLGWPTGPLLLVSSVVVAAVWPIAVVVLYFRKGSAGDAGRLG